MSPCNNTRFSCHHNNRGTLSSKTSLGRRCYAHLFLLFLFLTSYSLSEAQTYCTPSVSSSLQYINKVEIGTINNSPSGTGFTTGGFADNTNLSTNLEIGQTNIPLNIEVYANTFYDVQVWVDWDRDGEFTQANDSIICDDTMDNNGTNTKAYTFDVPATATAGATRMRIRLIFNHPTCSDPCLDFIYGEVEDYTLNIKEPITPLSPPVVGTVTQPTCGSPLGSIVLTDLPAGVDWEITQNPGNVKHFGTGTSTTISGLSPGTYTFNIDEQKCPGTGDGLTADYYNTIDLSGTPILTRIDPVVHFNWGQGAPGGPVAANNFSVHWSGQVLPCYTATYLFQTNSDDGIRLWVDGTQVINNWTDHAPTLNTGTIDLIAGKRYDIILEYYEKWGGAVAELEWSNAFEPMDTIPQSQLFSDIFSKEYIASSNSVAVVINAPPVTVYTLSGGGSHCLGSESVTLSLSGSETDVTYQLYADGVPYGAPTSGTGAPIDFDNISTEGTYTVVGTHNTIGCSENMAGSAVLTNISPSAPIIGTITQPTCVTPKGSVVLSGLPSQWHIFQTPNDTNYYGEGSTSTTITNLEAGNYKFAVATGYSGTGLLAEYYGNMYLTGTPLLTRIDTTIDFNLGNGSPASGVINVDNYSVHWSGKVEAKYTEEYTFTTNSDDGIRLWVNGTQVINNWTDHAATLNSGTINLEANKKYDIVLEFYERGGQSVCELEWSSASQSQEIIPKSQLFPAGFIDDSCFSAFSDEAIVSAENAPPIMPDSITVDRNFLSNTDPDSITLMAHGGLGWTLKWYTGSCGGTQIGTDTTLTIPSPTATTRYYALWETSCGQSSCRSFDVIVISNATDSVTQIGNSTATLYGSIQEAFNIVEYGFYYSSINDKNNLVNGGSALVDTAYLGATINPINLSYSSNITGLTNRSAYYFRAYAKDASGNYYYGLVKRFISEERDFSLALDGDGDFLLIDRVSTHEIINDWGASDNTFSVDFWMRNISTSTDKMTLVSDTSNSGGIHTGYLIAFKAGQIYFESGGTMNKSDAIIFDQKWHHIACTYDNKETLIYVDDSLINSQNTNFTLRRPNNDVNCKIGATCDPNYPDKFCYFEGNVDAMRFWNIALTAEQIGELCYDNVKRNPLSNTIIGKASGRVIQGLAADNLTASLDFNVMSTQESPQAPPATLDYNTQSQMHNYPFFRDNAHMMEDKAGFNIVAVGDAKPSPYLPRVYWRHNNTDSLWTTPSNWGSMAYPGQGVQAGLYPDVSAVVINNDSIYCQYTVVDSSSTRAVIATTPPEVQILIDRHDSIGTYHVDTSASELTILKGIHPKLFDTTVDNEQGAIIIEEGSIEVYDF